MKCDFPHTREPEPAWAQLISFLSPMFVLGKIKARSPSALFKQSRSKLAAAGAGGLLGSTEGSARSSSLCSPLLAHVSISGGMGSIPGWGTKIPHAAHVTDRKKISQELATAVIPSMY